MGRAFLVVLGSSPQPCIGRQSGPLTTRVRLWPTLYSTSTSHPEASMIASRTQETRRAVASPPPPLMCWTDNDARHYLGGVAGFHRHRHCTRHIAILYKAPHVRMPAHTIQVFGRVWAGSADPYRETLCNQTGSVGCVSLDRCCGWWRRRRPHASTTRRPREGGVVAEPSSSWRRTGSALGTMKLGVVRSEGGRMHARR